MNDTLGRTDSWIFFLVDILRATHALVHCLQYCRQAYKCITRSCFQDMRLFEMRNNTNKPEV